MLVYSKQLTVKRQYEIKLRPKEDRRNVGDSMLLRTEEEKQMSHWSCLRRWRTAASSSAFLACEVCIIIHRLFLLTHFVQFQNPYPAFHSTETMAGVPSKPLEGFRFLPVLLPPQHNLRLPRVPNFFNVLCEEDRQVHWDSLSLSRTFSLFLANVDVCGKELPKEWCFFFFWIHELLIGQ